MPCTSTSNNPAKCGNDNDIVIVYSNKTLDHHGEPAFVVRPAPRGTAQCGLGHLNALLKKSHALFVYVYVC